MTSVIIKDDFNKEIIISFNKRINDYMKLQKTCRIIGKKVILMAICLHRNFSEIRPEINNKFENLYSLFTAKISAIELLLIQNIKNFNSHLYLMEIFLDYKKDVCELFKEYDLMIKKIHEESPKKDGYYNNAIEDIKKIINNKKNNLRIYLEEISTQIHEKSNIEKLKQHIETMISPEYIKNIELKFQANENNWKNLLHYDFFCNQEKTKVKQKLQIEYKWFFCLIKHILFPETSEKIEEIKKFKEELDKIKTLEERIFKEKLETLNEMMSEYSSAYYIKL